MLAIASCGGDEDRRGEPGPPPAPGPAPQVDASLRLGGSPAAVAAGLGGVWVADNLRGRLVRVEPEGPSVVGRSPAGQAPVGVAVGEGAVWVAGADGAVRRFDAATGEPTDTPERVPGAAGVAVGEGAVWVTSRSGGTVTRLDPATGRRSGSPIEVGPEPTDIAVGGGGVWVANSGQRNGTVSRIDPESREAGEPIEVVEGQVLALAYGEDGVWVAGTELGRGDEIAVLRVDPSSSGVEGALIRLDRPGLPVRLAAGAGSVWVAQGGSEPGTVARIDPERRRRVGSRARLEGSPTGVSVGEGAVWVSIGGAGAVTRVASGG